jgi:hypothetical protein
MLRGVPIQSAQRVYCNINAFIFWWPHLLVRTFIELAMLRIFLFSLGLTEFRVQHHGTFQFPPFINLF